MSAMSNYLENQLVDHILRGQTFSPTAPASVWIALYTAAPTDAGGGTEIPSTNNYSRVAVTRALTAWAGTQAAASTVASSGTGGITSNNAAITFPIPSGSWGTITHFAILDAVTGGNFLFTGALTVSQTVNTGNTVSFAAGQLVITFA
jgi:hypothetical protein